MALRSKIIYYLVSSRSKKASSPTGVLHADKPTFRRNPVMQGPCVGFAVAEVVGALFAKTVLQSSVNQNARSLKRHSCIQYIKQSKPTTIEETESLRYTHCIGGLFLFLIDYLFTLVQMAVAPLTISARI